MDAPRNERLNGRRTSLPAKIWDNKGVYIALLPTFLFLFVFMLYPALQAMMKSLYDWRMTDYYNPEFIGFGNYAEILSDPLFWKSMGILVVFLALGIFTLLFVNVPVTYLIYKLGEGRIGKFFQKMYVIPMMVPLIVGILFWRFFYEPNFGMLNHVLDSFGVETKNLPVWLGDSGTALPALLFIGFPFIVPFAFLILLAGFQAIDESLHESAELDGASSYDKFWKIDLPLIIPQVKILIILNIIGGIQQFYIQLIMTDGGPNYATMVPGLLMFKQGIAFGKLGYGSAIGVLLFILILLLTILTNEKLKKAA